MMNATVDLSAGAQAAVVLAIDVVDLDVPLLVSRMGLSPAKSRIDFSSNCLQIQGVMSTLLKITDR